MSDSVPYFNAEDLAITQAYISTLNLNALESEVSRETPHNVNWNFSNKVGFNLDDALAKLDFHIKGNAILDDGQPTDPSMECMFHFIFHIDNFEKYTSIEHGDTVIHGNLGNAILAVAYSTARGMLIGKTQNTLFRGWILPIVSPAKLMLTQDNQG